MTNFTTIVIPILTAIISSIVPIIALIHSNRMNKKLEEKNDEQSKKLEKMNKINMVNLYLFSIIQTINNISNELLISYRYNNNASNKPILAQQLKDSILECYSQMQYLINQLEYLKIYTPKTYNNYYDNLEKIKEYFQNIKEMNNTKSYIDTSKEYFKYLSEYINYMINFMYREINEDATIEDNILLDKINNVYLHIKTIHDNYYNKI